MRLVVRRKLVAGELPQDSITRFWGGISHGEECDACGERIRSDQLLVEAISTRTNQGLQFHIGCFYVWMGSATRLEGSITCATARRIVPEAKQRLETSSGHLLG